MESSEQNSNVIAVIEVINGIVSQVKLFPNTDEGEKECKEFVTKLLKENNPEIGDDLIKDTFERGGFDDLNGYEVVIKYTSLK